MRKTYGIALAATALVAATVAPCAWASGFSIYEQGAKASGMAGAYTAYADDASANWYNPANLVWMEGSQAQAGANFITAGGDSDFIANDPSFGIFGDTTFSPESSIETPVHFYYTTKVNSNIAWGVGLTTPFGLVTEWAQRPITFSAGKSELATFVINPNIAFRLTETWSMAVGVDYMFADVGSFSREVPIDLDGNPLNGFEVIGNSNLTGDGDDIGWNVAFSNRTPGYTFALTYRSALSPEIDGNIEYTNFGPLAAFFPSSGGTTTIDLPAQAAVGLGFQLTEALAIEFDVAYAEWSSFEEIAIDIDVNTPFSQDIVLREDWDDTLSYRIGLMWDTSEASQWRFGVVYDESPVPEEYLRPSIPDSDRTGLSIGYGYTGNKATWDFYYMALDFDEITAIPGAPESEGVIAGRYETFVNLAGVSLNWRF